MEQEEGLTCPHCGKLNDNPTNKRRHVEACPKRPRAVPAGGGLAAFGFRLVPKLPATAPPAASVSLAAASSSAAVAAATSAPAAAAAATTEPTVLSALTDSTATSGAAPCTASSAARSDVNESAGAGPEQPAPVPAPAPAPAATPPAAALADGGALGVPPPAACRGVDISHMFPSGPFVRHVSTQLATFPWSTDLRGWARHDKCTGVQEAGHACKECLRIPFIVALQKAAERARTSAGALGVTHAYLTLGQLSTRSLQQSADLRAERKLGTASQRQAAAAMRQRDMYADLLRAIAAADVPRINILLRVAQARGLGAKGMRQMLSRAVAGVYRAKSFTATEFDLMRLVLRIGGHALAYAVAQALALPAVSTVLSRVDRVTFLMSDSWAAAAVRRDELTNLEAVTRRWKPEPRIRQLEIDELAITPDVSWHVSSGRVLGLCRHYEPVVISSVDDVYALKARLDEGKVHRSNFATLVSIATLTSGEGESTGHAAPIFAGGDCRWDGNGEMQVFITGLIDAWYDASHGQSLALQYGPLATFGSDGDARRRRVWAALAANDLRPSLRALLVGCERLDLLCGPHDCVPVSDPRHLIKRMRRQIGCGLRVGDVFIGPAVLRKALAAAMAAAGRDVTTASLDALLDVIDKMNVKLALRLLAWLARLRPRTEDGNMYFVELSLPEDTRVALALLADWIHYGQALLDPTLSVRTALVHLSAFAFLTTALQGAAKREGGVSTCLPNVLEHDLQLTIKGLYVAAAQTILLARSTGKPQQLYITQLGSNGNENLIGAVRTVHHGMNVNALELQNRLTSATDMEDILSVHPEWRYMRDRRAIGAAIWDPDTTNDHTSSRTQTGNCTFTPATSDGELTVRWADGRQLALEAVQRASACIALDASLFDVATAVPPSAPTRPSGWTLLRPWGTLVGVTLPSLPPETAAVAAAAAATETAVVDGGPLTDVGAHEAADEAEGGYWEECARRMREGSVEDAASAPPSMLPGVDDSALASAETDEITSARPATSIPFPERDSTTTLPISSVVRRLLGRLYGERKPSLNRPERVMFLDSRPRGPTDDAPSAGETVLIQDHVALLVRVQTPAADGGSFAVMSVAARLEDMVCKQGATDSTPQRVVRPDTVAIDVLVTAETTLVVRPLVARYDPAELRLLTASVASAAGDDGGGGGGAGGTVAAASAAATAAAALIPIAMNPSSAPDADVEGESGSAYGGGGGGEGGGRAVWVSPGASSVPTVVKGDIVLPLGAQLAPYSYGGAIISRIDLSVLCAAGVAIFERLQATTGGAPALTKALASLPLVPLALVPPDAAVEVKDATEVMLSATARRPCVVAGCKAKPRPGEVRKHVAFHLLNGDYGEAEREFVCGQCGSSDGACGVTVRPRQAANRNAIDFGACPNGGAGLRVGSAGSGANVPYRCPVDDCTSVGLWLYGMKAHFCRVHPDSAVPDDAALGAAHTAWAKPGANPGVRAATRGAAGKKRPRTETETTFARGGGSGGGGDAGGGADSDVEVVDDAAAASKAAPAAGGGAAAAATGAAEAASAKVSPPPTCTFKVGDYVSKSAAATFSGRVTHLVLGTNAAGDVVTFYRVQYDGERADRYEELEAADLVQPVQRKTRGVRLDFALLSDTGVIR